MQAGRRLEVRDGVIWCHTPSPRVSATGTTTPRRSDIGDAFSVGDFGRPGRRLLYLRATRDLIIKVVV